MAKIPVDKVACAMTSHAMQIFAIENLLDILQKFKQETRCLQFAPTDMLRAYQQNCKNCYQIVIDFLAEDLNKDNEVILDFGTHELTIYSNKKRLELLKESMEGMILEVEQQLTSRGE